MAKFTYKNDRTLRALKPKPGQRYEVHDEHLSGLIVRITEKGTKTFSLIARYPGSTNPTRRAIGEYGAIELAAAREKAREWLALIAKGIDPQRELEQQRLAELRKRADTFEAICDKFITAKLKTQRRGYVVERILRNELLPHWGRRPVAELTHRDVRELIEDVVERGAATYAHNVFDAAQAVFSFALARDVVEFNPCRQLRRKDLIGAKRHRERTLTDVELVAFWRASGRIPYPFGQLFRLLLLTGVRLNEAAGAHWREFDLNKKLWIIPSQRFKSGAEHTVPLSHAACALLASLPRFRRGDFLFSASFGERPINGFSRAKAQLERRMLRTLRAMARQRGHEEPHSIELEPFILHDCRRTVRTRLSALKILDHIAELVIGHGRKGLQRIYDQHHYADEKREALDKWANYLRGITEPPPANVVSLAKARAQ